MAQFVESSVFFNVFSSALVAVEWNLLGDSDTTRDTWESKTKKNWASIKSLFKVSWFFFLYQESETKE